MSQQPRNNKQSFGNVMSSVVSAFLGVQSNKKREEDFTQGKPGTYIIAGILGTIIFVLAIVGIVKLVLKLAV